MNTYWISFAADHPGCEAMVFDLSLSEVPEEIIADYGKNRLIGVTELADHGDVPMTHLSENERNAAEQAGTIICDDCQ